MALDNLTLAYQLLELTPLFENAFVNKVSEIKNGFLKIKLHTKQGSKDLIVAPNNLFVSKYALQARHGKTPFASALKKELYNKRITGIELHEFDRVVVISFLEHKLILEMLGQGNKILVNNEGIILACHRKEEWKDRAIKKGIPYVFPKQNGSNPLKTTLVSFEQALKESGKDIVRTIIGSLNISPLIAEESLFQLKIDKSVPANSLTKPVSKKLLEKIKDFYTISPAVLKPVSYKSFPYPFVLSHLSEKPTLIESLNSFVDDLVSQELSKAEVKVEEDSRAEGVSKLEFNLKQQGEAKKKFENQVIENQKKAELIYTHYNELEEIRNAILKATKMGKTEKEIMYTFKEAALKGNRTAKLVTRIDLAKKKFDAELD